MKRILRLLRDSFRYLAFRYSESRGVYGSFEEAIAAAPKGKPIGYDNVDLAREYRNSLQLELASFDYPILFHLDHILEKIGKPCTVLDFGGNVGVHYLRYKKYLDLKNVNWVVCDVPSITRIGHEVCAAWPTVTFINDLAELRGRPVEIVLAVGSIQYVKEADFVPKCLIDAGIRPHHILIDQLPLYGGERFVTLQNGGLINYPQYVFNRNEFVSGIVNEGYDLVDKWIDDSDRCIIPFHPERSVQASSGLYFQKRE